MRRLPSFAFALLIVATSIVHASVSISARPTANMSCVSGVCSATAKNAVLNATDLAHMLSTGNVSVVSGSAAKDITVSAGLSWTSSNRLTLDAYHALAFTKAVVIAGSGALTILTNDGGSGGDFQFSAKGHVEFDDLSSSLIINGNSYYLFDNLHTLWKHIHHGPQGFYALATKVNARRPYPQSPIQTMQGVLEGLGNTISNLTIQDSNSRDEVGLVGHLEATTGTVAIVRDFRLENVDVSASGDENSTGARVGFNRGSVTHVFVSGQVSDSGRSSFVGGLVGNNQFGAIAQSSTDATVTSSGTMIGTEAIAAGGVVGSSQGNCEIGPPCSGSVDQSYAVGTVNGGEGASVGGLAGQNLGSAISNSFAAGAVSGGNNAFVGGLVGSNSDDDSEQATASLSASYSYGAVSGGSGSTPGGLIGQDLAAGGRSNLYWDLDSSGISNPSQGAGNVANDPGITGLTTAELKSALPGGFSTTIWKETSKVDDGYPYLPNAPSH